ncbi:hypothetical protein HN51_044314 [Arachis hypogaea]
MAVAVCEGEEEGSNSNSHIEGCNHSSLSTTPSFFYIWWSEPQMFHFLLGIASFLIQTRKRFSLLGKKSIREEPSKRKNPGAVKISPWTLARLNVEEVSKAAAEARKRSKILKPVVRHNDAFRLEPESSLGSRGRQVPRIDNKRRAASKQGFLPTDIAMASMTNVSANNIGKDFSGVSSLAPLQLEPRSAFHMSQAMSSSAANVVTSSDLLLEGQDLP